MVRTSRRRREGRGFESRRPRMDSFPFAPKGHADTIRTCQSGLAFHAGIARVAVSLQPGLPMKRVTFLAILLVSSCIRSVAQPAVQISGGNLVQLGEIYEGAVVRKELVFRNTGHDTLRISGVETSCSCTVPSIDR